MKPKKNATAPPPSSSIAITAAVATAAAPPPPSSGACAARAAASTVLGDSLNVSPGWSEGVAGAAAPSEAAAGASLRATSHPPSPFHPYPPTVRLGGPPSPPACAADLLPEVVHLILTHAPFADRLRCALVCRAWRDAVRDLGGPIWSDATLTGRYTWREGLADITVRSRSLTRLTLGGVDRTKWPSVFAVRDATVALAKLPSLRALRAPLHNVDPTRPATHTYLGHLMDSLGPSSVTALTLFAYTGALGRSLVATPASRSALARLRVLDLAAAPARHNPVATWLAPATALTRLGWGSSSPPLLPHLPALAALTLGTEPPSVVVAMPSDGHLAALAASTAVTLARVRSLTVLVNEAGIPGHIIEQGEGPPDLDARLVPSLDPALRGATRIVALAETGVASEPSNLITRAPALADLTWKRGTDGAVAPVHWSSLAAARGLTALRCADTYAGTSLPPRPPAAPGTPFASLRVLELRNVPVPADGGVTITLPDVGAGAAPSLTTLIVGCAPPPPASPPTGCVELASLMAWPTRLRVLMVEHAVLVCDDAVGRARSPDPTHTSLLARADPLAAPFLARILRNTRLLEVDGCGEGPVPGGGAVHLHGCVPRAGCATTTAAVAALLSTVGRRACQETAADCLFMRMRDAAGEDEWD